MQEQDEINNNLPETKEKNDKKIKIKPKNANGNKEDQEEAAKTPPTISKSQEIIRPPIDPQKMLIARLHMQDATWGNSAHFQHDDLSLKFYQIYKNIWYQRMLTFRTIIFLSSSFLYEFMPDVIALCIESFLFVLTVLHYILCWKFMGFDHIKRKWQFWLVLIIIVIFPFELILRVFYAHVVLHFTIGEILRLLLLICSAENKQIRMALKNMAKMWQLAVIAFVVYIIITFLFALMFVRLLSDGEYKWANRHDYMNSIQEALYTLVVFATTVNSPDMILPALAKSKFFTVLWVLAFAVNVILPLIAFALGMDQFSEVIAIEMKRIHERKEEKIKKAHEILSFEKEENQEEFVIYKETFIEFMSYMSPNTLIAQKEIIFYFLNDGQEINYLTYERFKNLTTILMALNIQVKHMRPTVLERLIPWYKTRANLIFMNIIKNAFFDYFVYTVILANIVINFSLPDGDSTKEILEFSFLGFYILEMFLRIYSFGLKTYFGSNWYRFDLFIIIFATTAAIVIKSVESAKSLGSMKAILLIFRILRLARIVRTIPRVNNYMGAIHFILPGIYTYLMIFWMYLSLSTWLGVSFYGGMIKNSTWDTVNNPYCGVDELKSTDFAILHYCQINFNDYISALNTMIALVVANNWHIISQGYEDISVKTMWLTRLFFLFMVLLFKLFITFLFARLIEVINIYFKHFDQTLKKDMITFIKSLGLYYSKRDLLNSPGVAAGNIECTCRTKKVGLYTSESYDIDFIGTSPRRVTERQIRFGSLLYVNPLHSKIQNPENVRFRVKRIKRRTEECLMDQWSTS